MENTSFENCLPALGLGAISGMRAAVAPAILSHFLAKLPVSSLHNSPLGYLQAPKFATGLKLLAVAEIVADKLPGTPDRISPPQLLVRIVSGALVGTTFCQATGESKIIGALLGGLGAVAASYALFYLRKKLGQTTGIPDPALAVLEDALAITGGVALLK